MNTYESVDKFNRESCKERAKVGSVQYWVDLENQTRRIAEELQELIHAIEAKDLTEVVDAGCDLDVVVAGLNRITGANYQEAINKVLDNNMTKVLSSFKEAQVSLEYNIDKYPDEDFEIKTFTLSDEEERYTIHRVSDDKIMKPCGFTAVDLSSDVPEDEVGYFILTNSEIDENIVNVGSIFKVQTILNITDESYNREDEVYNALAKIVEENGGATLFEFDIETKLTLNTFSLVMGGTNES